MNRQVVTNIISWMHPSYRDLVIDEISNQTKMRREFLKRMSVQGMKLALSDTGGAKGKRAFPLMNDLESWNIIREKCYQIARSQNSNETADLLTILINAIASSINEQVTYELKLAIEVTCEAARTTWDETGVSLGASQLSAYCRASELLTPLAPLPKLDRSWQSLTANFQNTLNEAKITNSLEPYVVKSWAEFAQVIKENEPRFLSQIKLQKSYLADVQVFLELAEDATKYELIDPSDDELKSEVDSLTELGDCVSILLTLFPILYSKLDKLRESLSTRIEEIEAGISENQIPDEDSYFDYGRDMVESFDIKALFADL